MKFEKYSFDELDIEFLSYVLDELEKRIGDKAQAHEVISCSGFLKQLQEDPMYVHHFDEKYWADYILSQHQKKALMTI
ncbi:hypothetical protein [Lederbergia panacisoli]|uniref:hypothetical protein n=1 Tax=Lederbergia panacisoli TaxID=1255251 RepID=UPI00214C1A0C|nr:hypothetical protein [Lederbergia panacisoli]MCR2823787.1 hypothetical protein [Lederbergia panacisoli]